MLARHRPVRARTWSTVGIGRTRSPRRSRAGQRPALYLLPLQLLALERALAKGLDPDHPRHLTAVIHLDELARGVLNEEEP